MAHMGIDSSRHTLILAVGNVEQFLPLGHSLGKDSSLERNSLFKFGESLFCQPLSLSHTELQYTFLE